MAGITLGDVTLFFKGDATNVGQVADRVKADINGHMDTLQGGINKTVASFQDMTQKAGLALAGFGTAILAPFGLATKAAADFGKGMAEIASLGVKDLKGVEDAVKSAATTYGVDLKDGVNAAYQALSSGVPEANIATFLEEAAKAATAGMTDLSTAIEFGSNMVNVWGGDVKTQFDQAFVAVKDGVLRFEDLNASIGRLAPTFNGAGLASKDMYASVAALTTQGIKAEEAVTGMKAVLSNIIKPTSDAAKAAESLGIQFDIGAVKSQGLAGFLDGLKEATHGDIAVMSQLFGSVEALNAVMALTSEGGGAKFDQILKDMDASAGATAEAFETIVKNDPTMAWKILRGEMQVLSVEIGQALLPALKGVVDRLKPIVASVLEWTRAHQELTQNIVMAVAAIGALSAGLGAVLLAIGPIITAFFVLRGAMTALGLIQTASGMTALGTAAAGAGGGVMSMVASLAGPVGLIAALGTTIYMVGKAAESIADYIYWNRQAEETEKELAPKVEELAKRLEEKGIAVDRTKLATMDLNEQTAYLSEQYALYREGLEKGIVTTDANTESAAKLNETIGVQSGAFDNGIAAQESYNERSKSLWSSLSDWITSVMGSAWERIKEWFGSDDGVPEPKAKGGMVGGEGEMATIIAGEEGPEKADFPGGGSTILGMRGPGMFTVPVGTYIHTAAETVDQMIAGAFAEGGTVQKTQGMMLRQYDNLKNRFFKLLQAALRAGKVSLDSFNEAFLDVAGGILPFDDTWSKNGKVMGASGTSFKLGGPMRVEFLPEQHGGLLETIRGRLNLKDIPGFAMGGMVGSGGSRGSTTQNITVPISVAELHVREEADVERVAVRVSELVARRTRAAGGLNY